MKQIYILIFKSEIDNINGFFDRQELMAHEAQHLNSDRKDDGIWVLQPNY